MCSPLVRLNIIFNLGNSNIPLRERERERREREREREVFEEEEKIKWQDY